MYLPTQIFESKLAMKQKQPKCTIKLTFYRFFLLFGRWFPKNHMRYTRNTHRKLIINYEFLLWYSEFNIFFIVVISLKETVFLLLLFLMLFFFGLSGSLKQVYVRRRRWRKRRRRRRKVFYTKDFSTVVVVAYSKMYRDTKRNPKAINKKTKKKRTYYTLLHTHTHNTSMSITRMFFLLLLLYITLFL